MSDKWGILPIATSPQMRINIPILQVKMKYFDLFYSTDRNFFSLSLKSTLESVIDVGQGISVGPGRFGKKNKRRALNKHRA